MIVGGAMLGYCSIGSDTKPMTPNMTMRIEITVESTGRFIKLSNFICSYFNELRNRCGGAAIPSGNKPSDAALATLVQAVSIFMPTVACTLCGRIINLTVLSYYFPKSFFSFERSLWSAPIASVFFSFSAYCASVTGLISIPSVSEVMPLITIRSPTCRPEVMM